MPRKDRDAWSAKSREWLNFLRPENPESERGVVSADTKYNYGRYLREAGDILGHPSPHAVTLEEMKALERRVSGLAERTIRLKCSTTREFLKWCNNKNAVKWKISAHPRPFKGGVFLREPQVYVLHQCTRGLGPTEDLVACLAVDMGLRSVDVNRLTVQNAEDFLALRCSDIRGKGRDGGKVDGQAFNDYVEGPLRRYLELRKTLIAKYGGKERPELILREIDNHGKMRLGPWVKRQYTALMKVISKALGLKVGYHDLRRTLGNRLWRRGYKIEVIAKILRHDDCGTTFRAYIGADLDDMRDALNGLNASCPGTPGQAF